MALAALTITSLLQVVIVWWSGSVALLADTIHNIGDGLNSVPLLIAFYLARRAATRRYSYGFSRAEDVAGVFIVLSIAFSAGVIFWESIQKLIDPQPLTNLSWVGVAAVVGFLGNEAVALLQIRTGRRIGSAAMVADGLHARTDGLTSLAVLVAAGEHLDLPDRGGEPRGEALHEVAGRIFGRARIGGGEDADLHAPSADAGRARAPTLR